MENSMTIEELYEKLEQSNALVQTLREENNRLEEISNSLVSELQNTLQLSKSLNDECQLLKKEKLLHTINNADKDAEEIIQDLEKVINNKNITIHQLEGLLYQSRASHDRSIEQITLMEDKVKVYMSTHTYSVFLSLVTYAYISLFI